MIDLQQAEKIKQRLDKSPENYLEIIEDTFLGICITDETGVFHAVNDNYSIMYGFSKDELVGNNFTMVLEESQRSKLQELHDLFMKMKDEIMRNWEVQHKDGTLFKISADAGYSGEIAGSPHKITFVWPNEESRQKDMLDNFKGISA